MSEKPNKESIELFAQSSEGPGFTEPWQAETFAMTVKLYEAGHFTWKEWTRHLGAEIAASKKLSEPDTEETYYCCWLRAIEKLASQKGLTSESELSEQRDAWERAARATPHGQPIELQTKRN